MRKGGGQKFFIAFLTHNLLPLTRVRRRIFPKISEIIAFLTKNFSPRYEGLFFIAFLTHNFLGRTNEGRGGLTPPLRMYDRITIMNTKNV